jgi:hypothetical protein
MPNGDDRLVLMICWNVLCVLAAIWFLSGSFFKASVVAGFVFVSCVLGYGTKWLVRAGFVICLVALAVFLGAPPVERWPGLVSKLPQAVASMARGVLLKE